MFSFHVLFVSYAVVGVDDAAEGGALLVGLAALTVYAAYVSATQNKSFQQEFGRALSSAVDKIKGAFTNASTKAEEECPKKKEEEEAKKEKEAEAEAEVKLTPKIEKQMGKRGWTEDSIKDTVKNPSHVSEAANKANGNPAEAYFDKEGNYVVQDKVTKEIIQVSNKNDPNWVPDPTIKNPPP